MPSRPNRLFSHLAAFLLLLVSSLTGIAQADVTDSLARSYNSAFLSPALGRISKVDAKCVGCAGQTAEEKNENHLCTNFYDKIAGDGVVRIHLSFGYFDDSESESVQVDFKNLGHNSSSDQAFYMVMIKGLTGRCKGDMQACRFTEVAPGKLVKRVRSPEGKDVTFEITAEYSSLTPYYQVNTVDRASEQRQKSEANRQSFMNALRTDDAVFYLGHSRNGGGPDFLPPRLMANGHPNYHGYYQPEHPGFNDLLAGIRARGEAPPLLAMYSCMSEAWFGAKLYSLSPHSSYIFSQSDKLSGMNEHFQAAFATIDGLTRFQCAQGMQDEVRAARTDSNVNELLRNLMSERSPVNTRARPLVKAD